MLKCVIAYDFGAVGYDALQVEFLPKSKDQKPINESLEKGNIEQNIYYILNKPKANFAFRNKLLNGNGGFGRRKEKFIIT